MIPVHHYFVAVKLQERKGWKWHFRFQVYDKTRVFTSIQRFEVSEKALQKDLPTILRIVAMWLTNLPKLKAKKA